MKDFPLDISLISQPRPPGSAEHRVVRGHLVDTMAAMQLTPYSGGRYELPYYKSDEHTLSNVVGILPGRDRSLPAMLLGAHYDSVPETPGADDNAAAIWVVLNAIAGIEPGTLNRSVIVALFDAEEPPYYMTELMGSTRFYRAQLCHPLHCTFIFDLVGHDVPVAGLEDLMFITGMESHPSFEPVISKLTPDPGMRIIPTLNAYIGDLSDHHVFRTFGDAYLFLSCGRWRHYHAPTDTLDKLNMRKMQVLVSYVRSLLAECDQSAFPVERPEYDTTATELRFMNEHLGRLLGQLKIPVLRSRKDIDRLTQTMTGLFGL